VLTDLTAVANPAGETELRGIALEGAGDGVWAWNLAANTLHLSPSWKAQLGFADHELPNALESWLGRVHPDDRARLRDALSAHLEGRTARFALEHRLRDRDGSDRWVLSRGIAERDRHRRPRWLVGTQVDVTAYKEAEARLQHDALHDPLTGLANRALFLDRLELALLRGQRSEAPVACAVLFVDLDRFKLVNDSLGHLAGDRLLQVAAQRLAGAVRPQDTVARLGGDEFTVLLEALADEGEAEMVAERVHAALAAPVSLEGRELRVSASIGIASADAQARPEDLLRDADLAMYRAKGTGPGRCATFDAAMREQAVARLDVETALRHALEAGELALHYQPVATTGTGRIVAMEALFRWPGGAGDLEAPELLALAEETELIVPIGAWVLVEACRQLAQWRALPGAEELTVSVNVGSVELADPGFPGRVAHALEASGLDGEALRLEVSERALSRDPDGVVATLARVAAQTGVRAQVDDFGAGAASVRALHRFPGDAVKLDRTFVRDLGGDPFAEDVLRAVVALARTLELTVIAEGVETPEQLERAARLGCELAQGYAVAVPLPGAQAARVIAAAVS